MQITLVQHEIEDAVKAYVLNTLAVSENQPVNVEFKATRGEEGIIATLTIAKSPSSSVEALAQFKASAITPPLPATTRTVVMRSKAGQAHAEQAGKGERPTIPSTSDEPKASAVEPTQEDSPLPDPLPDMVAAYQEQTKISAPVETPQEVATADTPAAPAPKAPEIKQEAAVTPVTSPKALFPSLSSSAPTPAPSAPAEASGKPGATPGPGPGPKSLFANLTKPVHDVPAV